MKREIQFADLLYQSTQKYNTYYSGYTEYLARKLQLFKSGTKTLKMKSCGKSKGYKVPSRKWWWS